LQTQNETVRKTLYDYQLEDLNTIFEELNNLPQGSNLLYQLPTGGGKTVVFSEIARRYIQDTKKKVVVLTHRIELSRKLFKHFEHATILGVTATPLSSNIKLPMKDHYKKLIMGKSIKSLIDKGFLAKAKLHNYDVSLRSLKLGINGDYTVKSSDEF